MSCDWSSYASQYKYVNNLGNGGLNCDITDTICVIPIFCNNSKLVVVL